MTDDLKQKADAARTSLRAALESDRALLRRIVEAWDIIIKTQPPFAQASSMLQAVINEARARGPSRTTSSGSGRTIRFGVAPTVSSSESHPRSDARL